MKAVITMTGKDRIGVIGKVCTYLAEHRINILDISQTVIGGEYLNMAMIVDLAASDLAFDAIAAGLDELGQEICYVIRIQHEEIFKSMHRV
ncbi:MAG: ACT domain-containing protein [Peptococcaceae bacterium]|nr:ACT domain-containing protein [Peptococcaceae bacterium]